MAFSFHAGVNRTGKLFYILSNYSKTAANTGLTTFINFSHFSIVSKSAINDHPNVCKSLLTLSTMPTSKDLSKEAVLEMFLAKQYFAIC
jgi:hypothetical protein